MTTEKAHPPPYRLTDEAVPDMMDQLQSWVTLDQCKAHLRLLHHFSALHNACASRSELDHFAFLCTAERRYTDWMHALARAVGQDPALASQAPIPPLDVALFWAAHMLSPIRYMDDMYRLFPAVPQMHQIQFPIQSLVAHADGGLVNAESQYFWSNYVSATEPYTLPIDTPLHAFSTPFTCPYCKSTRAVTDAASYVRFRLNGQALLCTTCHEPGSVMQSCTSRLLDDLVAFRASPATHRLPGSHIDPDTRLFEPSVNRDQLTAMLVSHAKEWDALLATYTTLPSHARDVQRATLNLDELLKPVRGPVAKTHKRACKIIKSPTRNLYSRLIGSYQNIPVGPWSMDLVQAVLRQREFTDKMAHEAVQAQAGQFAMRAQNRYRKFLMLIRDHPNLFVVPTLDIDLGWHTHQLLGAKYAEFTQRLTGKVVNHDDSVGKGKLRSGVHETGVLWYKKFGEPYACDAKHQKFWTASRVAPAILFAPILGPIQLYTASNHKQAINPSGDCAVHSPSSDPVQHKQAFSTFASSKSSSRHVPASKRQSDDPTKSSRLAPDAHPTPYLFFYSGCGLGSGSGMSDFSDARVGAATSAGGGGEVAGCGTVGGSQCGTGGDGGGGGGCGGGGCGGGGCGGG